MNIDIMREQDLIARLGIPDKIIVTEFGNRDLCYYELRTVFKIEPANDNRLGWISVKTKTPGCRPSTLGNCSDMSSWRM